MRYERRKELKNHSAAELAKTLTHFDPEYPVWIQHVDSIYPVIGISSEIINDMISLESEETYGNKPSRTILSKDLIEELNNIIKNYDESDDVEICAEATCNPDKTLDMQLTDPCTFAAVESYSCTKSIYLITGTPVVYC